MALSEIDGSNEGGLTAPHLATLTTTVCNLKQFSSAYDTNFAERKQCLNILLKFHITKLLSFFKVMINFIRYIGKSLFIP